MKCCTVITTHPPKFKYAVKFIDSYYKYVNTDNHDLYFIFTTQEDADNLQSLTNHKFNSLILPSELRDFKSIINVKKYYAIDVLKDKYPYIGVYDCESEIVKTADLTQIYRDIYESKTIKCNPTNFGSSTTGKFPHGNLTNYILAKLDLPLNDELYLALNNNYYWWFNEIPVYESKSFSKFYSWFLSLDNLDDIRNDYWCFDYILYSLWLVAYEDFTFKKLTDTKLSWGAVEEFRMDPEQKNILSGIFNSYWDTNALNHHLFPNIKIIFHTDVNPLNKNLMNTCIFTTHATLDLTHAEYSLKSLFQNQTKDISWDNFVIYNTHEHEVSNSDIVDLIKKYDTKGYAKEIFIYPYDPENNRKNLLQDIRNWYSVGLSLDLPNNPGKTLWLKSDYCVSNNFNEVLINHRTHNFMWSLPIYNAKQRISNDAILDKLNLPEFSPTDEKTYYRGGDNPNNDIPNEEISPNGEMDYHPSIDYVSHNYVNDYNLHVISNDSLGLGYQISHHPQVFDMNSTWGGPHNLFFLLKQNNIYFSGETKAYGIHMFHEIISENRKDDRGDDRKLHIGEKY